MPPATVLLVAGRSVEAEARRAVAVHAATERLEEQRRLRVEKTANPAGYAAMMAAAAPAQRWQWNSSGGRILLTILVLAFTMALGAVFTELPR